MTTTDQLAGIEARASAATEGPWKVKECAPCTGRGRLDVSIWAHDGNVSIADWCDEDEFTKADAEFIAHARTDVPALLAMVREQQAAHERVRELHQPEMAAGRDGNGVTDYCPACSTYYPCATIAAITATEAS